MKSPITAETGNTDLCLPFRKETKTLITLMQQVAQDSLAYIQDSGNFTNADE